MPPPVSRHQQELAKALRSAPYVVIEDDVEIGNNCTLYPFVHISQGARIGDDFKAYAHVSVREFCQIGNNVILAGRRQGWNRRLWLRQDRMTAATTKSRSRESSSWKTTSRLAPMPPSIAQLSAKRAFEEARKSIISCKSATLRCRRKHAAVRAGRLGREFEDRAQRDPDRTGRSRGTS